MDGSFDFAFDRGRRAAFGGRIESAAQLEYVSARVFDDFIALNDVSVSQPHFARWLKPKEFRRWGFHEVFTLDEEFAGERNLA